MEVAGTDYFTMFMMFAGAAALVVMIILVTKPGKTNQVNDTKPKLSDNDKSPE